MNCLLVYFLMIATMCWVLGVVNKRFSRRTSNLSSGDSVVDSVSTGKTEKYFLHDGTQHREYPFSSSDELVAALENFKHYGTIVGRLLFREC